MIEKSRKHVGAFLQHLRIDREFILYIVSFAVFHGSRFLVFLWAARVLGLVSFGVWNLLNLILVYSGLFHLGVLSGMNRDVPYYRGRGEADQVTEIKAVALSSMLTTGLIAALGILAASFAIDAAFRLPFQLMALLLVASQFFNYLQTYLRSDLKFTQMSYQLLAYALLFPLLVVPFTLSFDLAGFILGQSLAILAIGIVFAIAIPIEFRFWLNLDRIRSLIRTGFPILMVGLLFGLLSTADRWIIASLLGTEALGAYSLSILVAGMLTLLPTAVSMQIYPRMAESYGEHGSYGPLKSWMLRQSVLSLAAIVPISIGIYFIMPIVVREFLPDYVGGIAAMQIILIGVVLLPFHKGFAAFLNTVGKQAYYLAVQVIAVLLNVILNYIFVAWGWGIDGVALGTSITYVVYTVALIGISLWLMRREPK